MTINHAASDELKGQLKLLGEVASSVCALVEVSGKEYFQLKMSPVTCQKPMVDAVAAADQRVMIPFETIS